MQQEFGDALFGWGGEVGHCITGRARHIAPMRILVCGGREFADWRTVSDALWAIHHDTRILELIHGGARGADDMAACWARQNGVNQRTFKPDWQAFGKAAGPIRNERMLREGKPDLVIAFPGGRGTADMVRRAESAGVPVRRI